MSAGSPVPGDPIDDKDNHHGKQGNAEEEDEQHHKWNGDGHGRVAVGIRRLFNGVEVFWRWGGLKFWWGERPREPRKS